MVEMAEVAPSGRVRKRRRWWAWRARGCQRSEKYDGWSWYGRRRGEKGGCHACEGGMPGDSALGTAIAGVASSGTAGRQQRLRGSRARRGRARNDDGRDVVVGDGGDAEEATVHSPATGGTTLPTGSHLAPGRHVRRAVWGLARASTRRAVRTSVPGALNVSLTRSPSRRERMERSTKQLAEARTQRETLVLVPGDHLPGHESPSSGAGGSERAPAANSLTRSSLRHSWAATKGCGVWDKGRHWWRAKDAGTLYQPDPTKCTIGAGSAPPPHRRCT